MPAKKPAKRVAKKISTSDLHRGRTTSPPVITSASEWGREAKEKIKGRPLTVPSGKTCLVKMLDSLQEFLTRGDVPNALMPLMQEAATGKTESEESVMEFVLQDPERLSDMFSLVDTIVIECVIEPPVAPVPQREVIDSEGVKFVTIPPHERDDDDTLYVDYIELEDKFFIFNYALSGVSDIDQFRAITHQSVEVVRAVEDMDAITIGDPAS